MKSGLPEELVDDDDDLIVRLHSHFFAIFDATISRDNRPLAALNRNVHNHYGHYIVSEKSGFMCASHHLSISSSVRSGLSVGWPFRSALPIRGKWTPSLSI